MMKAARGGFLNIVRRLKEAGADCHTRSNVIEFVFSVRLLCGLSRFEIVTCHMLSVCVPVHAPNNYFPPNHRVVVFCAVFHHLRQSLVIC